MISGSLRQGSTNTALLRTAAALDRPAIEAVLYLYTSLGDLPHFNRVWLCWRDVIRQAAWGTMLSA